METWFEITIPDDFQESGSYIFCEKFLQNQRRTIMSRILTTLIFVFLSSAMLQAQEEKQFHQTYPAKESVHIKLASGDCTIEPGTEGSIVVDVKQSVMPEDAFEPEIYESGNSLKISEQWRGHSSGRVIWTITVPPATEVSFSSASGDLDVSGLQKKLKATAASGDIRAENIRGELRIKTASGDIHVKDCNGDIEITAASGDIECDGLSGDTELSAASGDVNLRESKGFFDISTASGDVKCSGLKIDGYSSFSAASGDITIRLAAACAYDLELSAASGDVSLDYNGQPLKGYFEFEARKSSGSISAPYSFDREDEFEKNGQTYVKKSFTRDGDSPRITMHTASGRITLSK
jgi:hypothetical protein